MSDHLSLNTKRIIKFILTVVGVLLGTYIFFKASVFFAPFIIGYLLSLIADPFIRLLTNKLKFNRKIAALISVVFMLLILGLVLTLIILKLITEMKSLISVLPVYFNDFYNNLTVLISKGKEFYDWLPAEITNNIGSLISNLSNTLIRLFNSVVSGALSTAISIPEALIFILVTILSTYFISSDKQVIRDYIKSQLPKSWIKKLVNVKDEVFSAIFKYIKAQLVIMTITFTELFIGFSIIRINYALVLAVVISVIDILPILGTGGILVPWSIYSFLTGDIKMGVSIFILYIIILVVRQLIEPKIVSQQIGVYPLLTLMAMFIGMKIFGVLGLILGPITFLILKNIISGLFKNRSFKELIGNPRNKDSS